MQAGFDAIADMPPVKRYRTKAPKHGPPRELYSATIKTVREFRIARIFVALICIAVLLVCTVIGPSAAHLDLAILALVFCFLVVFRPSLRGLSASNSGVRPISFLTVHISRPPPAA